mgnify:CR=1 FL=1
MAFFRQLGVESGVTAVIGSGGKTSLLRRLAEEVPGTVILCTTTHIRPSTEYPLLTEPTPETVRQALADSRVICLGTPCENGKLTASALPVEALAGLADYVLVEADGSRQLPLKAHGPHEPVIPSASRRTICVAGASGFALQVFLATFAVAYAVERGADRQPVLYAFALASVLSVFFVVGMGRLSDQLGRRPVMVVGLVLFIGDGQSASGETEYKLAQTVALFLGKNMEN